MPSGAHQDFPLQLPAQFNIAEEFVSRPAREHPRRVAILGEPRTVSYGELAEEANRVAAALLGSGVAPGDRVLISLPDSLEFIAAFFGAVRIGAVAVPVNPFSRAAGFGHYLENSGAKIAIVHAVSQQEFVPGLSSGAITLVVIVGEPAQGSTPSIPASIKAIEWSEWLPANAEEIPLHPTMPADPAFFLYTSGSGGHPKGAVHRHQDMMYTSRGFAHGVLGIRPDDRMFSVSKLFFAYGLGNGMYFPFSIGAATILDPERPKTERAAAMIAKYRPTIFFSVPTFYAALLRESERGLSLDFSSVRLAVSAGETLPAEIFERFRTRFGLEILDGIGSTEMLHMFLSSRIGKAKPGSCGIEVPGCEAKILDENGEEVPNGDLGNLWVKGGSAFSEYWKLPELTARTKQGDWVATNDKFTRDADGYYHYCGRADDMMKVSGMWVSPGEVENALLGHPSVAEAAVVAHLNPDGLLFPAAYIVLGQGIPENANLGSEIRNWLRERLLGYKCPQEVHFLAELPKTATGKIQRFRLRDSRS
ncbi:MAG: benzoate-CoA ligase family protein [Candidatus Acidiferrales bacterium]|jgi:benzoate-CoA ligase family protein